MPALDRDEALEILRQCAVRSPLVHRAAGGRARQARFKQRPPAGVVRRRRGARQRRSDWAHVLGFLALLARADVELDALTFLEGAVAVLLDCRVVDEYVVARLRVR